MRSHRQQIEEFTAFFKRGQLDLVELVVGRVSFTDISVKAILQSPQEAFDVREAPGKRAICSTDISMYSLGWHTLKIGSSEYKTNGSIPSTSILMKSGRS